jgi:hypothetical protein
MVQRKDRRHPGSEIVTARTIAGVPKFGHQTVPALRDVAVVDPNYGRSWRESIPRQGGHDQIEVLKHRQHLHVVEETTGPAMGEEERHTPAGCRTPMHKVDALPHEVVQRVELPLPGTPVELIGPVGHE